MPHSHPKLRERLIVSLLFVYMIINFADKAVLGIVAVPMMKDLNLSPSQFGLVASSFFSLYSISGIAVGFLANRFNTKWIITGLALIWAVTQFPIAWWPTLPILVACRVILGIGEGPAYPVAIHAAYKWFPDSRRNLITAIIAQGGPAGVVVAAPILSYLLVRFGWQSAFIALGVVGLLWTAFWLAFGAEGTQTQSAEQQPVNGGTPSDSFRVPYSQLLSDRSIVGTGIASFASYWILAMGFTWLPLYLRNGLGYDAINAGWLVSAIIATSIPLQIAGAALSQKLLKRGATSRAARAGIMSGFITVGGLAILVAIMSNLDPVGKIIFLAIGSALPHIAFCIGPAIIGEITPVTQRGALLAINNSIATLAGLIAPAVTGWIIQVAKTPAVGYGHGYILAASVLISAGGAGLLLINPESSRFRLAHTQSRLERLRPFITQ
jgi:MFS family permease